MKFTTVLLYVLHVIQIDCKSLKRRREIPSEPDLFEGDMAGFNPDTIEDLVRENNDAHHIYDPNVQSGAATNRLFAQWPQGKVYYTLSSTYNQEQRRMILDAMEDYHKLTCIKFILREDQKDYIYIKQGLGCYSWVGRQGGRQIVSLASGCLQHKGTAIHELMHALGFFHEQSRWDRDTYVDVKWENIDPEEKGNFKKYELDMLKNLNTPYDYGSVMHYGTHDFSHNDNPTMVAKKPNVVLGQRDGLSPIDIKEIHLLYRCKGHTTNTTTHIEIIQRGVRLFNHYDGCFVTSADECMNRCKSDTRCYAMTYDSGNTYSNGNCFFYQASYRAEADATMKWSSWMKHKIELGFRLHNHFTQYLVDNPMQCIERCQWFEECKAMTFDAGKTWSTMNCFLFKSDYKIQADPNMKWSAWRKE